MGGTAKVELTADLAADGGRLFCSFAITFAAIGTVSKVGKSN